MKKKFFGYGLMEIIVSLGVFSIIILVALGAFTAVMNGQSKNEKERKAFNELRFLFETITREFRTGSNYEITTGGDATCPTETDYCLSLINQAGASVTYYTLEASELHRVEKDTTTGTIFDRILNAEGTLVKIQNFESILPEGNLVQEYITLVLSADTYPFDDDTFYLQTTITSRNYEKILEI